MIFDPGLCVEPMGGCLLCTAAQVTLLFFGSDGVDEYGQNSRPGVLLGVVVLAVYVFRQVFVSH
ncbi:hypothetical protein [Arthrobacter sp. MYb213]|uniref:hypothetical protein n=1 Tax=Arthrobacter sp. MYb213 TaxID=1848595 RepID=UPI0011AFE981|nr:hypothetical protein [Arthrobacter sp. MYb213]